jgi:hypothetical protein
VTHTEIRRRIERIKADVAPLLRKPIIVRVEFVPANGGAPKHMEFELTTSRTAGLRQ